MEAVFTDFNEHFFLNKTFDYNTRMLSRAGGIHEYIFYKDHGKNSTITIQIHCMHEPVGLYVLIGKEKITDVHDLKQLLETYSTSYDKKCYTWKGTMNKVSRRVDHKTYRIGFVFQQLAGVVTLPIRVLSKQKKKRVSSSLKRKRVVGGVVVKEETRDTQLLQQLGAIVDRLDILSKKVSSLEASSIAHRRHGKEEELFRTFSHFDFDGE